MTQNVAKPKQLTARQAAFVAEYLVTLNATKAAKAAGYSDKGARTQGPRLLSNAVVAEAIEAGKAKRAKSLEITAERVLAEIGRVAFFNMEDILVIQEDGTAYIDLSALTREQASAIGEFTVEEYKDGKGDDARDVRRTKFKLNDKLKALDLAARHLGLLNDKLEVKSDITLEARILAGRARIARMKK